MLHVKKGRKQTKKWIGKWERGKASIQVNKCKRPPRCCWTATTLLLSFCHNEFCEPLFVNVGHYDLIEWQGRLKQKNFFKKKKLGNSFYRKILFNKSAIARVFHKQFFENRVIYICHNIASSIKQFLLLSNT